MVPKGFFQCFKACRLVFLLLGFVVVFLGGNKSDGLAALMRFVDAWKA